MSKRKLTPWFVNGEKPVRSGVYVVRSSGFRGFAYWSQADGWGAGADTPSEAYEDRHSGGMSDFFHTHGRSWRGLTNPSKAKP